MSDRMPEDMPDRMLEDLPDRMPEDMPDRMPEELPDRMPDRMPEDMSDRMPEDLPVRKCINVMVGITRSKVIEITFFLHVSHVFCFYSYIVFFGFNTRFFHIFCTYLLATVVAKSGTRIYRVSGVYPHIIPQNYRGFSGAVWESPNSSGPSSIRPLVERLIVCVDLNGNGILFTCIV